MYIVTFVYNGLLLIGFLAHFSLTLGGRPPLKTAVKTQAYTKTPSDRLTWQDDISGTIEWPALDLRVPLTFMLAKN